MYLITKYFLFLFLQLIKDLKAVKKQLTAKSNEVTELKSFVVAAVPGSSFLSIPSSARSSQVTPYCK